MARSSTERCRVQLTAANRKDPGGREGESPSDNRRRRLSSTRNGEQSYQCSRGGERETRLRIASGSYWTMSGRTFIVSRPDFAMAGQVRASLSWLLYESGHGARTNVQHGTRVFRLTSVANPNCKVRSRPRSVVISERRRAARRAEFKRERR